MLSVHAYGVPSATAPLEAMMIERRDLRPHDVLIEIKYCGICHWGAGPDSRVAVVGLESGRISLGQDTHKQGVRSENGAAGR